MPTGFERERERHPVQPDGEGGRGRVRTAILPLLLLFTLSCRSVEIDIITPTAVAPTPTLLPFPKTLDLLIVHDEVTARVNQARVADGQVRLQWDDVLQDYASIRAWEIVRGSPYDEIDHDTQHHQMILF